MQRVLTPAAIGSNGLLPIAATKISLYRGGRAVLDGVDFEIGDRPGLTVILGPNGAGKSLLARTLAGLVAPDAGSVTWAGLPPDRTRVRRIGFVFQRPVLLRRSAAGNIAFALKVTGLEPAAWTARVQEALDIAGLSALADQPARMLSGGEQQRLALARAIACRPDVLILDEPAANLDPASTAAIEALLRAIRQTQTPILMITHDLSQARRLADSIVFMHRGRIIETTAAEPFFREPGSPETAAFLRGEIVI